LEVHVRLIQALTVYAVNEEQHNNLDREREEVCRREQSRWVRMNSAQVVVRLRSGTGGMPWRRRTLPIV
jgi:hypothetical protein